MLKKLVNETVPLQTDADVGRNTGGHPDEMIQCGRTSMHPRSYAAEMKQEQAAMDSRMTYVVPVKTDKFKG